jgi:hypothetical protein
MIEKKYRYVTCRRGTVNNTILAEYASNLSVDLAIAKEIVASRVDFTQGKSYYCVIDLSNVKSVTNEAREYLQHPEGGLKGILGAAFFADNPLSHLIAEIFVKSPGMPQSGFFHNKKEAEEWISKLAEGNGQHMTQKDAEADNAR